MYRIEEKTKQFIFTLILFFSLFKLNRNLTGEKKNVP